MLLTPGGAKAKDPFLRRQTAQGKLGIMAAFCGFVFYFLPGRTCMLKPFAAGFRGGPCCRAVRAFALRRRC